MSDDEFDPSDVAARAVGDLADSDPADAVDSHAAAEGAEESAESTTSMGSDERKSKSVVGLAMHTQPDISVEQARTDLGVDDVGANAYIAGRKGLDYLLDAGESAAKEGVPLVVNLFRAVWGTLTAPTDDVDDVEDDAGDDQEESDDEAPDPDVTRGGVTGV